MKRENWSVLGSLASSEERRGEASWAGHLNSFARLTSYSRMGRSGEQRGGGTTFPSIHSWKVFSVYSVDSGRITGKRKDWFLLSPASIAAIQGSVWCWSHANWSLLMPLQYLVVLVWLPSLACLAQLPAFCTVFLVLSSPQLLPIFFRPRFSSALAAPCSSEPIQNLFPDPSIGPQHVSYLVTFLLMALGSTTLAFQS